MTRNRLAELFLFRAWTAQFGYRIFSSDRYASEKLIGETVNACKYLGLGVVEKLHGFSIESELGADFITLIEDRWKEYDLVISTRLRSEGIPTDKLIEVLSLRLIIYDVSVMYKLSIDLLSQLDFIKRTAMEIGILSV